MVANKDEKCLRTAIMGLSRYRNRKTGEAPFTWILWRGRRDWRVEVGGHGVVAHAGSAATRLLADRTGLTGGAVGRASPAGVRSRCMTGAG